MAWGLAASDEPASTVPAPASTPPQARDPAPAAVSPAVGDPAPAVAQPDSAPAPVPDKVAVEVETLDADPAGSAKTGAATETSPKTTAGAPSKATKKAVRRKGTDGTDDTSQDASAKPEPPGLPAFKDVEL